jgi:hypothetical protein
VEGDGEHELEIGWHIGAGLTPASEARPFFSDGVHSLAVLMEEASGWTHAVGEFSWSPVYGKSEAACVARFANRQKLPAEFVTVLVAHGKALRDSGRIEKISDSQSGDSQSGGVPAYRYLDERRECVFIFARGNSAWSHGVWSSDAEFLYASIDHASGARRLVLCGATYLAVERNRIVSCARRVSYAEVWSGTGASEICSSDPEAVTVEQPPSWLWRYGAPVVTKNK